MPWRTEKDLLGPREVPAERYWGVHTLRAIENFPPTGARVHKAFIAAMADVKKACAAMSASLGYLHDAKAPAIEAACEEVAAGRLADEFPVDALQGGAGTSTNMNVNEVIASRASELLGGGRGDASLVHPIDDVNLHQSTNDVCPTALRLAAIRRVRALSGTVHRLEASFRGKQQAFASIVKMGRTELQDAVPMTLGMEFSGWAEALARDAARIARTEEPLRVVNLGGTAIGTGITAPAEFIEGVAAKLAEQTGIPLLRGSNLIAETANSDAFVEVSSALKTHATNLLKITSDLRLLNLLGEIRLPPLQAGSSIMPAKVNPVVAEMTSQIALKVMANDFLVAEASSRAHLQINEFMPLIADAILESMDLLIVCGEKLMSYVDEITADPERCLGYVTRGVTLVTTLVPKLGYPAATRVAKEFLASGESNFVQFLERQFGDDVARSVVDPARVAELGFRREQSG